MFHGVTQRLQLPEVRGEVTVRRVRQGKGGRGREREGRNGKNRQLFRKKKKDTIVHLLQYGVQTKLMYKYTLLSFVVAVCVCLLFILKFLIISPGLRRPRSSILVRPLEDVDMSPLRGVGATQLRPAAPSGSSVL